jgi:hypothetical protein
MTESVVIALLAGLAGTGVARFALDAGQRLFFFTALAEFTTMVRLHSLAVDYRVFLFALCAAAAATGGAALLPALQATRLDLVSALRGEFGSAFRASRLRSALVVLQVVVCAVLLVCGALLYRRAGVFQNRPTGIRHDHVVFISSENTEVAAGLRLRADVEDVAVASGIPWMRRLSRTTVMASGESGAQIAGYNLVSPRYFHVLDIALRRGRFYTDQETRDGAAVAVVSQATAQAFWPGEDPIGKTIRPVEAWERHVDNLPLRGEFRVIGVAEDVIHGWAFDGTDRTCIYLPASERTAGAGLLLARVRGDEHAALQGIRQWLLDRWPEFEGQTFRLGAIFDMQIYPFRAAAWIGWMLGLVAMGLSVSGMYGVMSYIVNQQSKEIGIRMALGAAPAGVVSLVLRRSLRLASIGVVIGGALAAGAVQLVLWWSAALGILAWDAPAVACGPLLAGAAAVLASLGPSRRAARVDPNAVLRAD